MDALQKWLVGQPAPLKPESVKSSIDTLELFLRWTPPGLRKNIESVLGRRIQIERCLDSTGFLRGYRIIANRPTLSALPVLQRYWNFERWCSTFRVDVAVDYNFPTEGCRDEWMEFLRSSVILKWRARGRRHFIHDTTYWVDSHKSRNLALYSKKAHGARLELRFHNSGSVKRAGLFEPQKLPSLNPAVLFSHHLKLARVKPSYVKKIIRSNRDKDPRRIVGILSRIDTQEFVSGGWRSDSAIEKQPIEILRIPDHLTWP